MSEAISATGTLLYIGNGASPEVFTDVVPELRTITPPAQFRNALETTTHNDGEESHVLGIKRSDEIAFSMNWLKGNSIQDQLESDYQANTKRTYRIEYPDGVRLTFKARVSKFTPVEASPDSVKMLNCALRKSGAVVKSSAP